MSDLEEYFAEHNLESILGDVIFEVGINRPKVPLKFIIESLKRRLHTSTSNLKKEKIEKKFNSFPPSPQKNQQQQPLPKEKSFPAPELGNYAFGKSSAPEESPNLEKGSIFEEEHYLHEEEDTFLDEDKNFVRKIKRKSSTDITSQKIMPEVCLNSYRIEKKDTTGLSEVKVIDDKVSAITQRKYSVSHFSRRTSVVGESFKESELKDYKPPKFFKTEDQKMQLDACLRKNVLFHQLEKKERDMCFDAMREKVFKKGSVIRGC